MKTFKQFLKEELRMGNIQNLRGKELEHHLKNKRKLILNHLLDNWTADSAGKIRKFAKEITKHTTKNGILHDLHPGNTTIYRGTRKDDPKGATSWSTDRKTAEMYGNIKSKDITSEHPALDLDKLATSVGKKPAYREIIHND